MPAPGILTGSDNAEEIFRRTTSRAEPVSNSGVFGKHPGATPKYALNANGVDFQRDAEYKESMARLFIDIPESYRETFLSSVSARVRPLARVLSSGTGYIDFLLTQTSENFEEKAQIVDTLTDNFVAYYAGQAPPMVNCSGTLLNTYQDDQRVWMLRLYQEILRGSRLATRDLVARLRYDSFLLTGYLQNLSLQLTGDSVNGSNFTFSFLVKRMSIFTPQLGLPTRVSTPAVPSLLQESRTGLTDSQRTRVASVMPEQPSNASDGPASDSTSLTQQEQDNIRISLREQGLTDAQINAQLERSASLNPRSNAEDPREQFERIVFQGLDRITEQSTDIFANEDNVTNDGVSGTTNVRSSELINSPVSGSISLPNGIAVEVPVERWTGSRR